jgi:hypothetical protein
MGLSTLFCRRTMSDRCWDCGARWRPLTSTGLAPVKRTFRSYGQGESDVNPFETVVVSALSRGNPDEVILLRALAKNEEAAIDRIA